MRVLRLLALLLLLLAGVALPDAAARRREAAPAGAKKKTTSKTRPTGPAEKQAASRQPGGDKNKLARARTTSQKQRSKKKRHATRSKSKQSKSKHAKTTPSPRAVAPVVLPDPGDKRSNLPAGWQWPPSEAMRADAERCRARLTELGVTWRAGPELPMVVAPVELTAGEIGGVRITRLQRDRKPLVMDCRLAEAMAVVGVPILRESGIRELRYSSIHTMRNVRRDGRTQPQLSRHALALALDVHVFVTDEGTELLVKEDYHHLPLLLPDIERRLDESNAFRNVITPAKDPASHSDHFHFEARTFGDPGPNVPERAPPSGDDAPTGR